VGRVKITIDGREIEAAAGATVLDAATEAGIYIPHLCHSPGIKPYGACRMCIVEIQGMRGLPASCTTIVTDGMVVTNDSERVNKVRRVNCELMISDHPQECLTCASSKCCELQEVASFLGISEQRFKPLNREKILDESNPF